MGRMFAVGRGVAQRDVKAVEWYTERQLIKVILTRSLG